MTTPVSEPSPFKTWDAFKPRPKVYTHPFWIFISVIKWFLLFSLTITFFWGLGTLLFNRWVSTSQVTTYEFDSAGEEVYVGGVFFEIDSGYSSDLVFKRHIFHVNEGVLFEYDYYQVNSIDSAWHYSRSPFYVFLVLPTSWILTKITQGLSWNSSAVGSDKNLAVMIVGLFIATLILRLIAGFGVFRQQQNKEKMEAIQSQTAVIKNKYKDTDNLQEKQKMQWEIMELYRRENINPLSNSLESFAFAPFLFAMFVVVRTSRILKDSGTDNFSFTTTLWDQLKNAEAVYFIPIAVYLCLFAIDNLILPRLLINKTKDPNTLLEKDKKKGWGGIFKWVFRLIFLIFFFIVPVGTSVYWTFSTFFEICQKILFFLWGKRAQKQRIIEKRRRSSSLWDLKNSGLKLQ